MGGGKYLNTLCRIVPRVMVHGLTYERESKVNTVCLDPRYSSSKHTRRISGHPAYKVSRLRQVDQDAVSAEHARHRVLRTVGPPSTVTVTHGLTRTSWTGQVTVSGPLPLPPHHIHAYCVCVAGSRLCGLPQHTARQLIAGIPHYTA